MLDGVKYYIKKIEEEKRIGSTRVQFILLTRMISKVLTEKMVFNP